MGAAYEFFCILGVKFPSLGTQKQFTFDQISLSEVDKTAVWGKICGQTPQKSPEIPREGTEEVFKSDTYASKPPPPPFSLPRLDTATCIMSECSEQPPPLVLTMLGVVRLRAGT